MTQKYMAIRDRRLRGGVPARPHLAIHNTDASTPLRTVFNHVKHYAGAGKIHTVFILCHGYAGENKRLNISLDAGGMGLQLGREGVRQSNVNQWSEIKNKVSNIVVYACAAADTQPGNENTDADGQYLMGALALCTNANVFAADKIQWYYTHSDLPNGAFDFNTWDGNLYKFFATTGRGITTNKPPVELTQVLDGTAP
jgi:hypothetical protein